MNQARHPSRTHTDSRKPWIRPHVGRIDAGSAECFGRVVGMFIPLSAS